MPDRTRIDVVHLDKYVAGDKSLREEILLIYVSQAQRLVGEFSITQPDQEWRDTAHALKGASRGVGVWALGDLCEEAETLVGEIPAKSENRASILVAIREKVWLSIEDAESLCAEGGEKLSA